MKFTTTTLTNSATKYIKSLRNVYRRLWIYLDRDIFLRLIELMKKDLLIYAFGAVLLRPVENRQAGYQQIAAYLPHVQLDPEGASDFLYQINRPRNSNSGIPDLRINRLSKWSIAASMESTFSFGSTSAAHFPGPRHFACRLELDINTVPDFRDELAREQLPQIFQELVDLGKEIAKAGDIP